MPDHIFSIGLVPVQAFISEARRSRDLLAGSAILSWFMREILITLAESHPTTMLLPHESIWGKEKKRIEFSDILKDVSYSIPNRASGYIESSDSEVKQLFETELRQLVQRKWKDLFEKYFQNDHFVQQRLGSWKQFFEKAFVESSLSPVDLLWVVAPIDSEQDDPGNLKRIDQLFNNLKRTRPVTRWKGKNVGKCDQCGQREAISPDPYNSYADWWRQQRNLNNASWVKKGTRIDIEERLCIVCFTKRFAGYSGGGKFPSTNGVAAGKWLSSLASCDDVNVMKAFQSFQNLLSSLEIEDKEKLYYSRSITTQIEKEEDLEIQQKLKALKIARKNLHHSIQNSKRLNLRPEPSNYLAVLTFDGDSMGEKIREHFKTLPSQLIKFSNAIIKAFPSSTHFSPTKIFYIGGDEGLILSSIEIVLEVAFQIKKLFRDCVGNRVTLSMGVTLFDRERPSGGAIRLAQEALETAKGIEGKNALSITVQTASGNEFSTTATWKEGDSFWPRVEDSIHLINGQANPDQQKKSLSMGWAYEVEEFLHTLTDDPLKWQDSEFRKAVSAEVKRITFRKSGSTYSDEMWLNNLSGNQWFENVRNREDLEVIANALHLTAFLCRESAYKVEHIEGEPSHEQFI